MNSAEDTERPLSQLQYNGFNSLGGSNMSIVGILYDVRFNSASRNNIFPLSSLCISSFNKTSSFPSLNKQKYINKV